MEFFTFECKMDTSRCPIFKTMKGFQYSLPRSSCWHFQTPLQTTHQIQIIEIIISWKLRLGMRVRFRLLKKIQRWRGDNCVRPTWIVQNVTLFVTIKNPPHISFLTSTFLGLIYFLYLISLCVWICSGSGPKRYGHVVFPQY